jgi:hypothetical protein
MATAQSKRARLAVALLVAAQLLCQGDGEKEQFAYSLADLERTNASVVHLKQHVHPKYHSWLSDCYHPHPDYLPSLAWLSTLSACKRSMNADMIERLAAGYHKGTKLLIYTYEGAAAHEPWSGNYTAHTASLNAKYCQRWNCTFVSMGAEQCSAVGQAHRRLRAGSSGGLQRSAGAAGRAVLAEDPLGGEVRGGALGDGDKSSSGGGGGGGGGGGSGSGNQEASAAHCKVELLQQLLQQHGDAQLLLWLHPAAALVDHNLDVRLIPAMHPGEELGFACHSLVGLSRWQPWRGLAVAAFPELMPSCPDTLVPCQPQPRLAAPHALPANTAAAGATIYASPDWLPSGPASANTGALLFANTKQLPALLQAWRAALDRPLQQQDPDGFNELLAADSGFKAAVKLLPGCYLNDRPKSLVDRTFLAQMGCTGRTAAAVAEADVAAAQRQAAEAVSDAGLKASAAEALPVGPGPAAAQVDAPPKISPAERRVVERETFFGFWDTRWYNYSGSNGKGALSERD